MDKQGFKIASQYYRNAGIIWFILGIILSILSHFQIANFVLNQSNIIWYGKLQPILAKILIFGAILSFFFATILEELDHLQVDMIKPSIIGFITFIIHQFSLIFGLIIIMMGYNQGRSYGEFDYITDNLFMLVYTIIIVLTLIYSYKLEKMNGSIQIMVITLAGMITTYFLGNFGFPNSYITSVPPTSGYQDAMVNSFYKTSIFVFNISLPLIYILYSSLRKVYELQDTDANYILPLLFIVLLVSVSSGVGLGSSPFINLWTIIGNYVFSSINILLMGFIYNFYSIHKSLKKQKNSLFLVSVSIAVIFILFLYNFIFSLPIFYNSIQYTTADPFHFVNKLIYIAFPVFLLCLISFHNDRHRSIPSWMPIFLLILALIAFLSIFLEGIIVSNAVNEVANKELVNKEWSNVITKTSIYHIFQTVIEILYLLLSFYMVSLTVKEKQIELQEQKVA